MNTGETTYNSINVGFNYNGDPINDSGWDGFYLHIFKLPPGTTQEELDAMEMTDMNCTQAFITHNKADRNITAYNLEANTTYALIPGSFLRYTVVGTPKSDILCGSAVVETTALAPLPLPCLEVTAFSHISEQAAQFECNSDLSRCLPTKIKTYGAHPTWCFDKDEEGNPEWDGAELHRQTWDIVESKWGNATELLPHDPTDDTFDEERDFRDCGDDTEEIEEFGLYKYTLKAYKGDGDARVWAPEVTADITIAPDAPELDCTCCNK